MSWQVRLGNLDEEIENFLENNEDFPIKNKREFVKYAVRTFMQDNSSVEIKKLDENQLKELEERLKEGSL